MLRHILLIISSSNIFKYLQFIWISNVFIEYSIINKYIQGYNFHNIIMWIFLSEFAQIEIDLMKIFTNWASIFSKPFTNNVP